MKAKRPVTTKSISRILSTKFPPFAPGSNNGFQVSRVNDVMVRVYHHPLTTGKGETHNQIEPLEDYAQTLREQGYRIERIDTGDQPPYLVVR